MSLIVGKKENRLVARARTMLTSTLSMCVVHVLNGQTGFHFDSSQRSVSESLCFRSVLGFHHCSSLMLSRSVHRSWEKRVFYEAFI